MTDRVAVGPLLAVTLSLLATTALAQQQTPAEPPAAPAAAPMAVPAPAAPPMAAPIWRPH